MAGRSGLVLVLEDLHWADDALLDFIENLVAWSNGYPLLLVCTARDELLEQRAGWGRLPGSTVIDLQPLSDQQTTALLEAVGGIGLSDETRRALVAAAAGNPLYAQEFLRLLVDRGLLHREGDRWHLEPGRKIPVPDSIVGIVAARIDGLPAQDKAVLQNAAVVGEVHWPGAVAMVASRGRWAVEEAMSRLERRQLLRRRPDSSVAGEAEYMFEHSLVRDVAYGSILRVERAQRHLRAADWLESLPGDRSGRAETLVHHLLIGLEGAVSTPRDDVLERAVEALDTAGHRALALHSYPAAARLFTQAIDLAPSTAARRGHWLLGRGLALAMAGVPAHAALDQAAEQLVSDGDHKRAAEAISTMAWLDALAGRMDAARAYDDRALALSEGPPVTAADALVLTRAGTHRVFSTATRSAGLELLERALAVARDQHLRDIEAEALQFKGMGRIGGGDIAGVADVERALEIALDIGSPVLLSVYGNLADIRKRMADLRESERLHLAGLAAARQFGVPVQVRRFEAEQIAHLYWKGDWDSALARADAYLEAVETGSPHEMEAEVRVLRGRIRRARGDADAARSDADRAVGFARQTGHPYDLFPALAFAGRLGGQAEIEELLARLENDDPFWAARALPDAVAAALSFGTEAALRSVLERARPSTPWYEAALLCLEQSLVRAAGIYQRIGALPEEAEVWELLPATSLDPSVDAGKRRAERFLEAVGVAARASRPTIGM